MKGKKLRAALMARIRAYDDLPMTSDGRGKSGPSQNKNQRAHRPGSQNRKKGYGVRSGRR